MRVKQVRVRPKKVDGAPSRAYHGDGRLIEYKTEGVLVYFETHISRQIKAGALEIVTAGQKKKPAKKESEVE
jgi:hypothetical protein